MITRLKKAKYNSKHKCKHNLFYNQLYYVTLIKKKNNLYSPIL